MSRYLLFHCHTNPPSRHPCCQAHQSGHHAAKPFERTMAQCRRAVYDRRRTSARLSRLGFNQVSISVTKGHSHSFQWQSFPLLPFPHRSSSWTLDDHRNHRTAFELIVEDPQCIPLSDDSPPCQAPRFGKSESCLPLSIAHVVGSELVIGRWKAEPLLRHNSDAFSPNIRRKKT